MNEIIFRPSLKCEIAIDIKESVDYKPEGPAKGDWTIFGEQKSAFNKHTNKVCVSCS